MEMSLLEEKKKKQRAKDPGEGGFAIQVPVRLSNTDMDGGQSSKNRNSSTSWQPSGAVVSSVTICTDDSVDQVTPFASPKHCLELTPLSLLTQDEAGQKPSLEVENTTSPKKKPSKPQKNPPKSKAAKKDDDDFEDDDAMKDDFDPFGGSEGEEDDEPERKKKKTKPSPDKSSKDGGAAKPKGKAPKIADDEVRSSPLFFPFPLYSLWTVCDGMIVVERLWIIETFRQTGSCGRGC